jgi:putative ABC transport system ATP-binding protein
MGFVFQAFHVLPYLTVAQNVVLPLSLAGVADAVAAQRVAAILDAVGLGDRGASMPRELSGGELQRVAIARALVHSRSSFSPTSPLATSIPTRRRTCLGSARSGGHRAAGILVTHSRVAAATADRVLTPHDGLRGLTLLS